ncbi:MAG TPA: diacylglycerol kinase family lipid kinase [Bacteroidales bacterium]|jgi:YegS/Rv2252/BmrU family lipid kinase|nr:YegS/Rv2252/BmrU family lipid kinase [Bacteroidales bacterium]OQB61220.1 MAG: Diacylglycerol kinase [Bacteroidetes bacterium ADurb.Bin145]NMD02501.1 diacylglycerol kinase family lipid kinase [Bacteroidales bacterium]HOU02246.1 diacylglycerol kinase family lipid kinase [Bacteroidales bacterium]HQG62243.1 diacylglycerol kinase family lipid kinase [Bacteroidales bacterium]
MASDKVRPEWFTIVNPNAGNGKGKKDWNRIAGLFENKGIPVVPKFTEKKLQAIEFARDAIGDGFRKIIAVGGDGTLNEVINGIFSQEYCPGKDISVGMIPVGTGNDWGRMFGIPLVYEAAVDVIKQNKLLLHDIGVLTYHNGSEQNKRYFINIAGLGFEALVVRKTNRQKDRGRSNQTIYFFNLLTSLIAYKKTNVALEIDGRQYSAKIFSINVGNGRYCGGGMRQTPEALPDDGLLDITVIREMGRIEIIKNLKILYDGTILSHPKVDGYRSKNLKVTSEAILYAEADGESLGHTPVEFSIIPAAVNVVYGMKIIP